MKPYPLQLEISGPTAMWTRPDTGSSPVSYVAPTFSAVKGIFESVLRWKSVNVRPTKAEICAPVQFHRYTTNYGGPLRANDAINNGASFQFYTVVLVNVCYRLYAQAEFAGHHDGTTWPPHAYHDAFNRALDRGQWFYTVLSGLEGIRARLSDSESGFRDATSPCAAKNRVILPVCLEIVLDQPQDGMN